MKKNQSESPAIDPTTIDPKSIDKRIYDLYDDYCHSTMERREFLSRAAAITVVGGSGLVMAQALLPRYAEAQTISFTDKRIMARYVTYPSPGGTSGMMRGYLVQPKGDGPFPSVLIVHEPRPQPLYRGFGAPRGQGRVHGACPRRPDIGRRLSR